MGCEQKVCDSSALAEKIQVIAENERVGLEIEDALFECNASGKEAEISAECAMLLLTRIQALSDAEREIFVGGVFRRLNSRWNYLNEEIKRDSQAIDMALKALENGDLDRAHTILIATIPF